MGNTSSLAALSDMAYSAKVLVNNECKKGRNDGSNTEGRPTHVSSQCERCVVFGCAESPISGRGVAKEGISHGCASSHQ